MEGARPRGRPKKTWSKIVEKDCHVPVHGLNREDAMDCSRWMKQIRDRAVKRLCVTVCLGDKP